MQLVYLHLFLYLWAIRSRSFLILSGFNLRNMRPSFSYFQQYDWSLQSLGGHPDSLPLPFGPASNMATSRPGAVQLNQEAQPAVLSRSDASGVPPRAGYPQP